MSESLDKEDDLVQQVKNIYRNSIEWLEAYTGKVEIVFQGKLEVVFFVREPASFMWSQEESGGFLEQAGQTTFLNRMYLLIEEAKVFRYIADYRFEIAHAYGVAPRLALYVDSQMDGILLVTAILVNAACLFTVNQEAHRSNPTIRGLDDSHELYFACRLLLLVLCSARVCLYLLLRAPLILTIQWNRIFEKEIESLRKLTKVKRFDTDY